MADNRTIGEARKEAVDRLEDALTHSKDYSFNNKHMAVNFIGLCVLTAERMLGVNVQPKMPEKMIDRIREVKKVKVESRGIRLTPEGPLFFGEKGSNPHSYDDYEDKRRGVYVYKDNELAYFVSVPLYRESSIIALVRSEPKWIVRTNVKP